MYLKLIPYTGKSQSVFSKKEYLSTLSDKNGLIGGFVNNELICTISYVINRKLIFRYLRFISDVIIINGKKEDKQLFFNELIPFVKSLKVDFIQCSDAVAFSEYYPEAGTAARFGTYEIDLSKDEETLFAELHGKHRNVIRNAQKKNVKVIRLNSEISSSWEILTSTMSRSGMSFLSKKEYGDLIRDLGEDNIAVFIAYYEDSPICVAAFPYDKKRAYYLYGGSVSRIPVTGAMNYLHWFAMLYFKEKGVSWYDFVGARLETEKGSKLEGIQRFKKRFGADLRVGYLWRYVYNPFKFRLFNLIKKIKDSGYHGDMIDQEIRKGFGVK